MTKYKLEWTLKGIVEVEAEDKYEAMEIAENYTYEKLSDGLKSWHMEVKVPPPCKHDFKPDGGNWIKSPCLRGGCKECSSETFSDDETELVFRLAHDIIKRTCKELDCEPDECKECSITKVLEKLKRGGK